MSYTLPLSAEQVKDRLLRAAELFLKRESQVTEDSYIYVSVDHDIQDGTELKFKSPANCENIVGLRVSYKKGQTTEKKDFLFADAHGVLDSAIKLFAANVIVKVILDIPSEAEKAKASTEGTSEPVPLAFVQNADTNKYLEDRFSSVEENIRNLEADIPNRVVVEQSYFSDSENAISGKAVAEALESINIRTNGVSDVTTEEGIGCDWIYRKWSSGKCELSRKVELIATEKEAGVVRIKIPFIVYNAIPFVNIVNGTADSKITDVGFSTNTDNNNYDDIVLNFTQNNVDIISIKLEGIWK